MDWLTPTRRAVRWSPMLAALALATVTLVVVRLTVRPVRSDVLVVSLVMVVIGALCGLHDPGRDFVHAMPVSAGRRLAHRLVVILPALASALIILRWLATRMFAVLPPAPGWSALAAFGAVGVAACSVMTRRLGTRAVDAVVTGMLGWLGVAISTEQLDLPLGAVMPWWRWPVAIACGAVFVTVVATTRGVEA